MDRLTQKTSAILISVGDKTKVYRSLQDVPPGLRRRLEQSTTGENSATVLIADEGGRRQILRSLHGLPSQVESRLLESLRSRQDWKSSRKQLLGLEIRQWAEIGLLGAIGLLLWMLAVAR